MQLRRLHGRPVACAIQEVLKANAYAGKQGAIMAATDSIGILIGRPIRRVEDARLLRGAGRFVDDIELPNLMDAHFVRSPVAHARLHGLDTRKARAVAGVRAVLSYGDLRPILTCDRVPLALPLAALRFHVDPSYLAEQEL